MDIKLKELLEILKTDTVYTALRFAYKSPMKSGVDNYEDKGYIDLYNLIVELRLIDKENKNG